MTIRPTIIDARVRVTRRDQDSDPRVEVPPHLSRYNQLYGYDETLNVTTEQLISEMDASGVDHAVVHAEWEFGEPGLYRTLNDRVAEMVRQRPDRFTGVCSVDPRDGRQARRELHRALDQLNLRGLNLEPAFVGVPASDALYYPLYAECQERGVPVSIHVGVHFSRAQPLSLGNPVTLDEVACRFPELKLVAMHGGWPWVLEAIAVARRHPTVYLEYAGVAPKYLAVSGSGWEPVMQFCNSVLQDQVLYASDWPIIPFQRYLDEHDALPWKPDVRRKLFEENARRLYELPRQAVEDEL